MKPTLEEKREQMISFLLENIVAKTIERQDDDIIFTDKKGIRYFIKTLSRQSDFQYDFQEDPKGFDKDRFMLRAIRDGIASFIESKGYHVPGFIFLKADTDYSQLKERTESPVNRGHFLKQKLPDKDSPKPYFDERKLDPLEIVIQQFYKNACSKIGKTRVNGYGLYHPELYYFNPKQQIVDVVWFNDIGDPNKFKKEGCPICKKPNEPKYDHAPCREDQDYWKYAKAREAARYEKRMWAVKKKAHEMVFEPATVKCSYLGLPDRELRLAVIR